jgi:hypothetical protein
MPVYYFNMRDDSGYVADDEGIDLVDLVAVQEEALAGARDIIADRLKCAQPMRSETVFEVTDQAGAIVATLKFCDILTAAAADCS